MSIEERQLLKLNGLFFFTISLAGIFVNLFLFQLGDFKAVILYGLISLSVLNIVYFLSGYFLKKYSSKSLIQIGLLFFSLLYGLLLVLGERSINYLIPLGIINGIANGCYWAGNNLTQYIATHEHSRNEYFGKFNFFINIGSSIGPILGGLVIYLFNLYSIKFFGYIFVFFSVSLMFLVTFLVSRKLPGHKGSQFSFLQIVDHKRTPNWRVVLSQQFMYGLFDVAFGTIFPILVFIFLKQEFFVGAINTAATLVSAFSSILAIKILQKWKQGYILGMFLSSLGFFLFGTFQNLVGILWLILLSYTFMSFLNISTSKGMYDTIDHINENWDKKYHFLIEREFMLGIARVLTYSMFLLFFTPENQTAIAKNWIFIIALFPLVIGLLQVYKERKV